MDALRRITQIKNEIEGAAALEDQLRRYLRRGCSPEEKRLITEQLQMIDRRIVLAFNDLKALEIQFEAKNLMRRRDEKYPPIEPTRSVHFFGIDHMEARRAA